MRLKKQVYSRPGTQPATIIPLNRELQSAKCIQCDEPSRISIPTTQGMLIIDLGGISYCAADSNYTRIFYDGTNELLASKPLCLFQQLLPSGRFLRIHQSYVVNTEQIVSIHGDRVILRGGVIVPVSRRRRETLRQEIARKTITIQ